jgi:hypothetical protein
VFVLINNHIVSFIKTLYVSMSSCYNDVITEKRCLMTDKTYIKISTKGIETEDMNFGDAVQLCFSAIAELAKTAMTEGPGSEAELKDLKSGLYDLINNASSYTLSKLFPEMDPNPDLDVNMVMALENLMMNEQLSQLKLKNPRLYRRRIKELKRMQDECNYKRQVKPRTRTVSKTPNNNKGLYAVPKMPRSDEAGGKL